MSNLANTPPALKAESEAADPVVEFKVVGENILTGNTWECVTGIETRAEADKTRRGWARLESDYKIEYRVEGVRASQRG